MENRLGPNSTAVVPTNKLAAPKKMNTSDVAVYNTAQSKYLMAKRATQQMGSCNSKEVGKVIKAAMTDPNAAERYADTVGMDSNNRKVLQVFAEQGKEAGIKALFTSPDGQRTLSYAESRALYG